MNKIKLLEQCKNMRADLLNIDAAGYREAFPDLLDEAKESVKKNISSAIREIEDLNVRDGIDILEDALYTVDSLHIGESKFEDKFFVEIKDFLSDVEKVLEASVKFDSIVDKQRHG